MAALPDWWSDPDALPDWMLDALNDAQQTMSNLSKWQLCIRWLDVSPTSQHVALVLSTYMDTTTLKAFPSVATLSSDTGRKKATVRESLRTLESLGWLAIERYRNSRGDQRISNRYYGRFPDYNVWVKRAGGDGKVVSLWHSPF